MNDHFHPPADTPEESGAIAPSDGMLATLTVDDPAVMSRLHDRLAVAAADGALLDVAYRTVDSPVGKLLLAATPAGLVRVAYASSGFDAVLEDLARQVSVRVLRAPRRLDSVAHELDEYFDGRRHEFSVAVDLQLARGFRRTVLDRLLTIGYGRTESYAAVAAGSGRPAAVRAVGTACARNPLPIVIPCHRVVRSDGTIGQYAGGTDAKRRLLDLEVAG